MIQKIEVLVKEFEDIPQGYGIVNPPTKIHYLNKVMEELNKIPNSKLIDYIELTSEFILNGKTISVPLNPKLCPEITPHDVLSGSIQFKAIIYYEVING